VEIASRQLTVDFVNQSQASSEVAARCADLAEELGDMNRRYQAVASDVSERLKQLNSLQLQWSDYESLVSHLTQWFAKQDVRLDSLTKLLGRGVIQQAILECHVCTSFPFNTCVLCLVHCRHRLLSYLCLLYCVLFLLLTWSLHFGFSFHTHNMFG